MAIYHNGREEDIRPQREWSTIKVPKQTFHPPVSQIHMLGFSRKYFEQNRSLDVTVALIDCSFEVVTLQEDK